MGPDQPTPPIPAPAATPAPGAPGVPAVPVAPVPPGWTPPAPAGVGGGGFRPSPWAAAAAVPPPKASSNRTVLVVGVVVVLVVLAGVAGAMIAGSGHASAGNVDHQQISPQPRKQGPRVLPPPSTVPISGPQPSSPVTTTTTTAPPPPTTTPPGPGGGATDLGHGLSATLPSGWKVTYQNATEVFLGGNGVNFDVFYYPTQSGDTAATVLQRHQQSGALSNFSQFTISGIKAVPVPSGHVVDAIVGHGAGYAAQQSGGTFPIQSLVYVYVRQDGLGVVLHMFYAKGTFDTHKADFQSIFSSVLPTL